MIKLLIYSDFAINQDIDVNLAEYKHYFNQLFVFSTMSKIWHHFEWRLIIINHQLMSEILISCKSNKSVI